MTTCSPASWTTFANGKSLPDARGGTTTFQPPVAVPVSTCVVVDSPFRSEWAKSMASRVGVATSCSP